jgi:general secretion pathway protein B
MSYILEALKKADSERLVGNVPDLDSVHDRGVQSGGRKTRWLWILGALLAVNGILVSVMMLRNDGADEGSDHLPADSRPIAEAEQPAAAHLNIDPRPDARPPVPAYSPPAARPAPVVVPAAPPVTPAPPRATVTEPVETATHAATGRAAPTPAQVSAVKPQPQPGATGAIPEWDDLPLEFRSEFTVPRIDVHVYDTNPRMRFILVNLKKYREGERLESGALLEKITPEGVQLSFRGKQFIYRQ